MNDRNPNDESLLPEILRAISDYGLLQQMTPIQQQAIPALPPRQDVLASPQTGGGKLLSHYDPAKMAENPSETLKSNAWRINFLRRPVSLRPVG